MKISFTDRDFEMALLTFQEQTGATHQRSPYESTLILPKTLGKGQLSRTTFRDLGFDLFIQKHQFNEDLLLVAAAMKPQIAPIALKFLLSGKLGGSIQGVNAEISASPGEYWLVYCADQASHVELAAGSSLKTVEIIMTLQQFQEILGEEYPLSELQQHFHGKTLSPYCKGGKTTPLMAIALQQILRCPYEGPTRRLYLESKSLELISLVLDHLKIQQPSFQDRQSSPKRRRSLKPDDVRLIHQARDILTSRMDDPPSLLTLARLVGTNDHKLKQGFRQIFGTTVFGYLHGYRMERAAQLLQGNQMTVSGVAQAVGFSHRGCFAAAFKRKFGVNPSDYLAAHQKQYWDIQRKAPPSDHKDFG
ncbi:MAG: helix-turn-helix transcriptional regulator [Cyanophyceae cyanobacterium]